MLTPALRRKVRELYGRGGIVRTRLDCLELFCCLTTVIALELTPLASVLAGEESQVLRSDGKAVSSQVLAACDAAYAVAAETGGISIQRRTGSFSDETLQAPVLGCGLAISGSFARAESTGDAAVRLRDGFSARGWQEMPAYGADGKDGTSFAFRKADVACFARGEWNGGADGEPEIPAEDWYKVELFCTSPVLPENRSR
jgi:hypothetical protein